MRDSFPRERTSISNSLLRRRAGFMKSNGPTLTYSCCSFISQRIYANIYSLIYPIKTSLQNHCSLIGAQITILSITKIESCMLSSMGHVPSGRGWSWFPTTMSATKKDNVNKQHSESEKERRMKKGGIGKSRRLYGRQNGWAYQTTLCTLMAERRLGVTLKRQMLIKAARDSGELSGGRRREDHNE